MRKKADKKTKKKKAHDTTVDFVSDWLSYFLVPLLENKNFNDNRTLILLTFDETESALSS